MAPLQLLALCAFVPLTDPPAPPAAAAPPPAPPPSSAEPAPARTDPTALAVEAERLIKEGDDTVATYRAALKKLDEAVAAGDARSALYGRKADAYLRLGDLETAEDKKLAIYQQGLAVADEGIKRDPRCAPCWFYRGANLGRWGQTRGVMQSLFILGDVKTAFQKVIEIDPKHFDARLSLGLIDQKVPGFAGGNMERAESTFRSVLKAQPRFSRAALDLAELCWDTGKKDEARALVQRVLDEKAPLFPGEHRKFDLKRAKALLKSWG